MAKNAIDKLWNQRYSIFIIIGRITNEKEIDMQKTKTYEGQNIVKLAVTTAELAEMLGCGEYTARQVGEKSRARLDIGTRRTLWNVKSIQEYLDEIAS